MTPNDPVVEILRLAYRRGIVLLREQAEKAEQAVFSPIDMCVSKEEDNTQIFSKEEHAGTRL